MEKRWLTVSQIEKEHGLPAPTIRRYIQRHGHNLLIRKRSNSYLIAEESVKVIFEIRDLYAQGMGADEIDAELVRTGAPITVTVEEDEKEISVPISAAFNSLHKENAALNEKVEYLIESSRKQEEFNRQLVEQLKRQQEYIDTKLTERNDQVTALLTEWTEEKKETVTTQQPEPPKKSGFFARLFVGK